MLQCLSAAPRIVQHPACTCAALPRRGLLGLGAGLALAASAGRASAASGEYEAMLINCIDPRFTTGSYAWMGAVNMRDRYSQFVIAGGPIGAVHPRFAAWHGAFWDNLAITVRLHHIKRVVAFSHRDCGAARLAFGDAGVATRDAETSCHAEALRLFRAEVVQRKPGLVVVAGIMALDGTVEPV